MDPYRPPPSSSTSQQNPNHGAELGEVAHIRDSAIDNTEHVSEETLRIYRLRMLRQGLNTFRLRYLEEIGPDAMETVDEMLEQTLVENWGEDMRDAIMEELSWRPDDVPVNIQELMEEDLEGYLEEEDDTVFELEEDVGILDDTDLGDVAQGDGQGFWNDELDDQATYAMVHDTEHRYYNRRSSHRGRHRTTIEPEVPNPNPDPREPSPPPSNVDDCYDHFRHQIRALLRHHGPRTNPFNNRTPPARRHHKLWLNPSDHICRSCHRNRPRDGYRWWLLYTARHMSDSQFRVLCRRIRLGENFWFLLDAHARGTTRQRHLTLGW